MILGDPLKLLPFAVFIGAVVLLGLGKLNVQEALTLIAAGGALHAGTSAINNRNP